MASLFDDVIKHQIGTERIKAGEVKRILKLLKDLDERIIAILLSLPENYTQIQLTAAIKRIRGITRAFYASKVLSALNSVGRKATSMEVDFAESTVKKYLAGDELVSAPKKRDVFDAGINTKYQGRLLTKWVDDLAIDKIARVRDTVRTLGVENAKPSKIAAQTRQQIKVANNNASTITRSYVNHFTNISRDKTYEINPKIVEVLIWSNILDSRTTITCGVRSNKKYDPVTKAPIGHDNLWSGGPGVIHFGCRSVPIPTNAKNVIVAGPSKGKKFDEGEKTAIGGQGDYERGGNENKAGKVAKIPTKNNELEKQIVPATLDYDDWLRRQPRPFVEDSIGVGKARLFLDEKVPLQKFTVPDGRELTFEQLGIAA